jgi:hypothetical protein
MVMQLHCLSNAVHYHARARAPQRHELFGMGSVTKDVRVLPHFHVHGPFPQSSPLHLPVDHRAFILEAFGLLRKPRLDGLLLVGQAVLGRVLTDLLSDLHRTELRPAHGAEVRDLG